MAGGLWVVWAKSLAATAQPRGAEQRAFQHQRRQQEQIDRPQHIHQRAGEQRARQRAQRAARGDEAVKPLALIAAPQIGQIDQNTDTANRLNTVSQTKKTWETICWPMPRVSSSQKIRILAAKK